MARSRCGAAAGHQLGLSEVVIRGRLERARERLSVRLTRRGVTAPAGLVVAGAAAEARAAIPSALTHSTIRIASGFVANHTAAVLARGVLKSMLLNQVKVPAVLVCLLGVIAICLAEARPPASARSPVPVDDDAAAGRLAPAGPFPIDLAFSRRRPFTDYEKVAVSPTGKSIAYGVITPRKRTRRSVDAPVGTADPIHRDPPAPRRGRHRQVRSRWGPRAPPALPRHGPRTARSSPTTPTRGVPSAPGSTMWPGERPRVAADMRIKVHTHHDDRHAPDVEPRRAAVAGPGPAGGRGARRPPAAPGQARDRQGPAAARERASSSSRAAPSRPRPPGPGRRSFSNDESHVDLTAIDIRNGSTRVLLPSKLPGRSGPAFARYSPSGRFLAYISRPRPAPNPAADETMDVGIVKAGEAEPALHRAGLAPLPGAGELVGRPAGPRWRDPRLAPDR